MERGVGVRWVEEEGEADTKIVCCSLRISIDIILCLKIFKYGDSSSDLETVQKIIQEGLSKYVPSGVNNYIHTPYNRGINYEIF